MNGFDQLLEVEPGNCFPIYRYDMKPATKVNLASYHQLYGKIKIIITGQVPFGPSFPTRAIWSFKFRSHILWPYILNVPRCRNSFTSQSKECIDS